MARIPGYIIDQLSIYLYLSTKPQQASAGGRARQTGEVGVAVGRAGGQPPHLHRPPLGLVLGPQQAADHGLGSLQLQLPATIPCSVSLLVFHQWDTLTHIPIAGSSYWRIQIPSQNVMCGFIFVMFSNLQSASRRWKKDREEWNLANGINFSYTSPYMADNCSIVKT